jgi:hypothetical protein
MNLGEALEEMQRRARARAGAACGEATIRIEMPQGLIDYGHHLLVDLGDIERTLCRSRGRV